MKKYYGSFEFSQSEHEVKVTMDCHALGEWIGVLESEGRAGLAPLQEILDQTGGLPDAQFSYSFSLPAEGGWELLAGYMDARNEQSRREMDAWELHEAEWQRGKRKRVKDLLADVVASDDPIGELMEYLDEDF